MKQLIIYGLGDFARLVKHMAEADGQYDVIGFCADKQFVVANEFLGRPVVSVDAVRDLHANDDVELIVAAGYTSMVARERMFERSKAVGFKLASLISRHANVDQSATIGRNAVIFPGVQIEPFVTIGENCVIWSSAILCHDSRIDDHCFIAAQSIVGGRAQIGKRSFIGFNSTVLQEVDVGEDCLVGAKSLVMADVSASSKCFGAPARVVAMHGPEGVMVQ